MNSRFYYGFRSFPLKQNYGLFPLFLFLTLSLLPSTFLGQAEKDLSSYYNWFDGIIGIENTDVHYGVVYVEKHRAKSKKSKFFPTPYFTSGSVVFDQQPYHSLRVKYNVYEDELLMQVDNQFGGKTLQLHKNKISRFTVGEHRFIKIDIHEIADLKIEAGFYEILLEGVPFTLLKKYRRLLTQQLGSNLVFYEFETLDPDYIVKYDLTYYPLKKVSDVKALFPEGMVQLDDFIRNIPPNLNFEDGLKSTFTFLDTLVNEAKDKAEEE